MKTDGRRGRAIRIHQYSLKVDGKIYTVLANSKQQIKKRFSLSQNDIHKYCTWLVFDPERKMDYDLTKENGKVKKE